MINGRYVWNEKSFWVALVAFAVVSAKLFGVVIPQEFIDKLVELISVILGGAAIVNIGGKLLR